MLKKTKKYISSKEFGSREFWRIAKKSAIPLLSNGPEVLPSTSEKAKLFPKTFLKTLIIVDSVLLFSLHGLI